MDGKKNWIKRIIDKVLRREKKVKMLVLDIDQDIEEVVNLLNDNYMMPFASCDGNLRHHFDKWGNYDMDTTYGYIAMLDNEKTRDIIALLQDNDTYMVSVTSNRDMNLYGNELSGLRYGIYFDNIRGEKSKELTEIIKNYLDGKVKPTKEQRERIDRISEILENSLNTNMLIDFSIHEIFRLENDDPINSNYSVRLMEHVKTKDLRKIGLREINEKDQKLEIENSGFYYRTEDFEKVLAVTAGLINVYSILPDKELEEMEIVEEMPYEAEEVDEVTLQIQRLTEQMLKYREELKQRQVDKSIARHERKIAKKKEKNEEVEH